MKDKVSIFLFRRDLRIEDNLAWMALARAKHDVPILPIFVFQPTQIDPRKNAYYNQNSVEFMIESLAELRIALDGKLHFFEGEDTHVLDQLMTKFTIEAVAFNLDYTPFAMKRDDRLKKWCLAKGVDVITAEDYSLFPMHRLRTGNGTVYEVYTPFYKRCLQLANEIPKPVGKNVKVELYAKKLKGTVTDIHNYHGNIVNTNRALRGGRDAGVSILHRIRNKEFRDYEKERDFPAKEKTTKLSAYLKFGCVSVREAFWAACQTYGLQHGLVRELIWREFCAYVTYYHPYMLEQKPLRSKYEGMEWEFNEEWFDAWCKGETGFPIVDAAMRCLNTTGFMHNRLRMVAAMFLTKDMMMHWKHGEKYFAQTLVDYDPSSNVCGWQWCASVGADAQPYFRIFNPWTQSKRFDSHAEFIYRWIPELRDVPPEAIHQWDKYHVKYVDVKYPPPMLNHSEQSKQVKEFFKKYV